ncbi:MAG TPA: hypothetical protein PK967_11570 [Candidatus Hydrogenedentes bacterium]|nr:hypothetical protein [Candidatus Hydrogenedentota bacterium]
MMLAIVLLSGMAMSEADSPIAIEIHDGNGYASFTNRLHPGNRIGYRFHEHTPMIWGEIPENPADAGIEPKKIAQSEKAFARKRGVKSFSLDIGDMEWVKQRWTYYLAPVDDGVELLWMVETLDSGLNRYYGVQQCFRMGGVTNQEWRRAIAETPAFSEFDLWNVTEKDKAVKTSLTQVMRNGQWATLPAVPETVGARTPSGLVFDKERTGGNLDAMKEVGPYRAIMLDPIDNGLIARTDSGKTWVCGIYWEGASHVTDHHPADCLHAIVNIGGIPPHAKRAIRGKIYWFKGSPDDLAAHWRRDFRESMHEPSAACISSRS